MTVWHRTPEYILISEYYRDCYAVRSGVPKMNHIKEGIKLLIQWKRPDVEQRAFALHPILQDAKLMSFKSPLIAEFLPESLTLAQEYANIADKYLCRPETDYLTNSQDETELQDYLGNMSTSCAWMLLADKVQNQSDFRKCHWFSHARTRELELYFNLWIKTLRTYYL